MLEMNKISSTNFGEFGKYLDGTLRVVDSILDPYAVTLDGKKYVICHEDNVFAIVEEQGEDMMSYAVGLNEDGVLETYVDENDLYQILLSEDIPIVSKQSLSDKTIEQIYITHAKENQPQENLHYYKRTEDGLAELQLLYNVTRFKDNLELFFSYMNSKKADVIYLYEAKKILNMIQYMKKTSFVKFSGYDEYGKVLIDYPNGFVVTRAKSFYESDITQLISMYGLGLSIPKEMYQLFTGKHEKANSLQLIAREYRKNIGD